MALSNHVARVRLWAVLAAAALATIAVTRALAEVPGEIFNSGAGGRALGMGSAYTAVAQDAASLYYNPSGLGLLRSKHLLLQQAMLFEGAAYQYLAYAHNSKKRPGGWGIEVLKLGASGGKGRDALNNPSSDFNYSETGFGFGAGWRGVLLPELSLGLRFKTLQRKLAGSSDRLTGIDVGGQYGPLVNEKLMLGFVLQNGFTLRQGDTQDRLSPLLRIGAAYKVIGPLLVAADVSQNGDFHLGTEYAYGLGALRFGFQGTGLSFGGGLLFRKSFGLDLAIFSHPTLGMSQRYSLSYKFGTARAVQRMTSYAQEYYKNATIEFEKRNYVRAAVDLETALDANPKLQEAGWKGKTRRLKTLIAAMRLETEPELQAMLRQESEQTLLAHQAVVSYMDRDEPRAMLFAYTAHGTDPRNAATQALLRALGDLTRTEVRRDDVLGPGRLVDRRLQEAVEAVHARKYDEAIRACREALMLDPNNVNAWTRLGSAYFAAGDKVRAAEGYRNALRLDPTNTKLKQFMEQQGLR